MEYTLAPLGMTTSLDIGKALARYALFYLATVAAETRGSVAIPAPLSLRGSEKTAFMSSPAFLCPPHLHLKSSPPDLSGGRCLEERTLACVASGSPSDSQLSWSVEAITGCFGCFLPVPLPPGPGEGVVPESEDKIQTAEAGGGRAGI